MNKQCDIQNTDDEKIIGGEHNATAFLVKFPTELASYNKRVDFVNVRKEKWTIELFDPLITNGETNNFTFHIPDAVSTKGEILLQPIAFKPSGDVFMPFEVIKLTVENSVLYVQKQANENPDLILKAYKISQEAKDIADEALTRSAAAESAATASANSASSAAQSAAQAQTATSNAQTQATNAANSASQANTRAGNAETSANQAEQSANNANTRAANAETAATNAQNSASTAQTAATTAQQQATNSANSASQANTRAGNAETAATNAQASASVAQQSSTNAENKATAAESAAEAAKTAAQLAVDQTGTKVKVNGTVQGEVEFTGDPQTQITNIYSRFPKGNVENQLASCNDVIHTGIYYIRPADANRPNGVGVDSNTDYMLWANMHIGTAATVAQALWGSQMALDFRSNRFWVRNKNNGTWSAWAEMTNTSANQDIAGVKKFTGQLKTETNGVATIIKGTGSSSGTWQGLIIAGGLNSAFLMGEYSTLAGLGAHNAALNAWASFYIQPDGTAPVYIGRNKGAWTANDGVVKVQGGQGENNGYMRVNGKIQMGKYDIYEDTASGNLVFKKAR
jgi:hypothetical protein